MIGPWRDATRRGTPRAAGIRTAVVARILATMLACLAALSCPGEPPGEDHPAGAQARRDAPAAPAAARLTRGIALGMHDWGSCGYDTPLEEIAALGARAVELVIPYYQQDVQANSMGPRGHRTPTERCLDRTIQAAHRQGLAVWLLPVVLLESTGKREWRGSLQPEDPEAWWLAYRDLLLSVAALASRRGVEAVAVGSELVWSEAEEPRWREIIAAVRGVYGGKLFYSANWDHYEPVRFWDALDWIGISGYFELTKDPEAPPAVLREAWSKVRDKILPWVRARGRGLVFTEIGYPAVNGGAVHPWNYTLEAKPDEEEQDHALDAFFDAWRGVPELAAAFVYEWGVPGGVDEAYSPRGRIAEKRVREWMQEGHDLEGDDG